jgi:hypothetical protein
MTDPVTSMNRSRAAPPIALRILINLLRLSSSEPLFSICSSSVASNCSVTLSAVGHMPTARRAAGVMPTITAIPAARLNQLIMRYT